MRRFGRLKSFRHRGAYHRQLSDRERCEEVGIAADRDLEQAVRFCAVGSDLRRGFAASDAITLEAWVNPTKISSGQQVYVVGKGRTGNAGFAADNQNWSLRLVLMSQTCDRTTVSKFWASRGSVVSAVPTRVNFTRPYTE